SPSGLRRLAGRAGRPPCGLHSAAPRPGGGGPGPPRPGGRGARTQPAAERLRRRGLAVIEPERLPRADDPSGGRAWQCFDMGGPGRRKRSLPSFHVETQDTACDAWKRLLDRVEEAAADGREEFYPLRGLSPSERSEILTLPPSIAKLKAVKTLVLYGS